MFALSDDLSNYKNVDTSNFDLQSNETHSKIVNTNTSALEKAKKRQADAQRERDKLREVTREVNEIKCEMHDIKCMLSKLLER